MCVLVVELCQTLCNPMYYSCQAPLSMEFSRQEYWSGLPCPSPGDLPDSGIEPTTAASPVLQEDSLVLSPWRIPSIQLNNNFAGIILTWPLQCKKKNSPVGQNNVA